MTSEESAIVAFQRY